MIFSIIPQFSFAESDNITLGDKIETLCNTYSSTSDNGIGIYSDEYSLYRIVYKGQGCKLLNFFNISTASFVYVCHRQ